jgi:hypothetical protein
VKSLGTSWTVRIAKLRYREEKKMIIIICVIPPQPTPLPRALCRFRFV